MQSPMVGSFDSEDSLLNKDIARSFALLPYIEQIEQNVSQFKGLVYRGPNAFEVKRICKSTLLLS